MATGISLARTSAPKLLCAVLCLAVFGSLLRPAAAGAVVLAETGEPTVGYQPPALRALAQGTGKAAESFANRAGNPVVSKATVYLIYWDPDALYLPAWQGVINGFFAALPNAGGTETFLAVLGQYRGASGEGAGRTVAFGGASIDTNPYPSNGCFDPNAENRLLFYPESCLSASQLQEQLVSFVSGHGLPVGPERLYFLLTPPGVTTCLDGGGVNGRCSDFYRGTTAEVESQGAEVLPLVEKEEVEAQEKAAKNEPFSESKRLASYRRSFCSYHSYAQTASGPLLFAVLPWTAGGLHDPALPANDQSGAYDCQDGSYNPVSKPPEQLAQGGSTKPTQQEPNQGGSGAGANAGLADLVVTQASSELEDLLTNPYLNGWQGEGGAEVSDLCRNYFAPASGNFAAEEESGAGRVSNLTLGSRSFLAAEAFNLAALGTGYLKQPCAEGSVLNVRLVGPASAKVGEKVLLSAGETETSVGWYGRSLHEPVGYATYTWSFGDGTGVSGTGPGSPACAQENNSGCALSEAHTYTAPGNYTVTLTVKDGAGQVGSAAVHLSVEGTPTAPPPPTKEREGSKGAQPPPPHLAVRVLLRSLHVVLRRGLRLRFKVNEEVAGAASLLVPGRLAHRLHLRGKRVQLPTKGVERYVVVGRRLLVTRGKGAATVVVPFRPAVRHKLRRLHRLTLFLVVAVRGGAKGKPPITYQVDTVRLTG